MASCVLLNLPRSSRPIVPAASAVVKFVGAQVVSGRLQKSCGSRLGCRECHLQLLGPGLGGAGDQVAVGDDELEGGGHARRGVKDDDLAGLAPEVAIDAFQRTGGAQALQMVEAATGERPVADAQVGGR